MSKVADRLHREEAMDPLWGEAALEDLPSHRQEMRSGPRCWISTGPELLWMLRHSLRWVKTFCPSICISHSDNEQSKDNLFWLSGIYVTAYGGKCQQSATSSCGAWAAAWTATTTSTTTATAISTAAAEWSEDINTHWDNDQVQQQNAKHGQPHEHQAVQHSSAPLLSGSFFI